MNTIQKLTVNAVAVTVLFALGGCSGMSARDKNTAIGAGVGAVGGSILTGGSAVGTVGGAAVGGIIGHEIKKYPVRQRLHPGQWCNCVPNLKKGAPSCSIPLPSS